MEASLHRHAWLNHWPLVADLTPSPSPRMSGVRLKFQPSNYTVGSAGNKSPALSRDRKSPSPKHFQELRTGGQTLSRCSYRSGNSRGFGAANWKLLRDCSCRRNSAFSPFTRLGKQFVLFISHLQRACEGTTM